MLGCLFLYIVGTNTTVRVGVVDLVSDLMEKVHDKLTSSASQVWVVDNEGKGERERD